MHYSISCTLYRIEKRGLAVIQQRFDSETKSTWWSEVDPWITDALYLHPDFREYFEMRAGACTDGLYEYLYKPYEKLGGNGSAKRIMTEVDQLAIHKSTYNA